MPCTQTRAFCMYKDVCSSVEELQRTAGVGADSADVVSKVTRSTTNVCVQRYNT